MDPVLRHSVQLFLEGVQQDHQLADEGRCTCGADLPEPPSMEQAAELRHVLDVIAAAFAPRDDLAPHKVHQKGAVVALETETVTTPADDSDPRPKGTKVTGARYAGSLSCPDCGRGLVSRDDGGMLCPQLAPDAAPASCHPGCIVACGGRTDG
jgi:hypothetical protein